MIKKVEEATKVQYVPLTKEEHAAAVKQYEADVLAEELENAGLDPDEMKDNCCDHEHNETVPVGGGETITVCYDCGDEL